MSNPEIEIHKMINRENLVLRQLPWSFEDKIMRHCFNAKLIQIHSEIVGVTETIKYNGWIITLQKSMASFRQFLCGNHFFEAHIAKSQLRPFYESVKGDGGWFSQWRFPSAAADSRVLKRTLFFGLITQAKSYLQGESRKLGIPAFGVEFYRRRIDPLAALRIRQIINEFQPDLVQVRGSRAGLFCVTSGVKARVVYTLHGFHFAHKNFAMRWFAMQAERLICRFATSVTFVCRHDLLTAEAAKLLPSDTRRRVIYYGIGFEEIPTANGSD